jgi:hypothetical protein
LKVVLLLPQSQTRVHVEGPNPRIVEGGTGRRGWARLAALALVALARSVADAATIATAANVVSIVLAIAAMVATVSLTLAAIMRGKRQSRGRRHRGVV